MGAREIKRLTAEALIVLLVSLAVLFGGRMLTSGQTNTRVQGEYSGIRRP